MAGKVLQNVTSLTPLLTTSDIYDAKNNPNGVLVTTGSVGQFVGVSQEDLDRKQDRPTDGTTVFGFRAAAQSPGSVSIGYEAYAEFCGSVAVGGTAKSFEGGVAVGNGASARSLGVAVGIATKACSCGTSIGYAARAGTEGIAIGPRACAENTGIAIGKFAQVPYWNSIVIGNALLAHPSDYSCCGPNYMRGATIIGFGDACSSMSNMPHSVTLTSYSCCGITTQLHTGADVCKAEGGWVGVSYFDHLSGTSGGAIISAKKFADMLVSFGGTYWSGPWYEVPFDSCCSC